MDLKFKLITLIITKTLFVFSLQGQEPITFLNVYDYKNGETGGFDVINSNNGSFIIAGLNVKRNPVDYALYMLKIDSTGNEIWEKSYENIAYFPVDDNTPYLPTDQFKTAKAYNGGGIIASAYQENPSEKPKAYLLRINNQGDSLWSYKYPDTNKTAFFDVQATKDSGFVAVGYGQASPNKIYPIISRIDKNGQENWHKALNDSSSLFSVAKGQDKGWIATGVHFTTKGSGTADAHIVKIAPNGEIEWNQTIGENDALEKGQAIIPNYGNGYVIVGVYAPGNLVRSWFLEIDSAGNKIRDQYFDSTYDESTRAIVQTENGDYMYSGHDLRNNTKGEVSLYRFSSKGQKIWHHSVDQLSEPNDNPQPAGLIKVNKDHYLAVGGIDGEATDHHTFALKFDGQGNYSGIFRTFEQKNNRLYNVYPNPVKRCLKVVSKGKNFNYTPHFTILNAMGQVVFKRQLSKSKFQLSLKPGIYLYRIMNDDGSLIQSGRLIKK